MNILEIKNLHTYFETKRGTVKAVNGVSLSIEEGKTLGVIGESGSGKSQTAMSVLKLFEKNQTIAEGEIIFDGQDIAKLDEKAMRNIRGNLISMIFQEPMTSLNPVFTIERQIAEPFIVHQGLNKKEAKKKVIEMLSSVKIPNPEQMAKCYPHELSGGMRQRVMIATALAGNPKLLIADEPTTALDVTIAAQILYLLDEIKQRQKTAIMFITHDLGVINEIADDVAVLYCGQVVELAPKRYIYEKQKKFSHPYTDALLRSMPGNTARTAERLTVIEGSVPLPYQLPKGCKFSPRCEFATEKCKTLQPELLKVDEFQSVRCFYPGIERGNDG